MQYWTPDWKLERAGFGGAGGGMPGIRGITYLEGEVLATYPRDEIRGLVISRKVKLGPKPALTLDVGVDPGRAWELMVYADNLPLTRRLVAAPPEAKERTWQSFELALGAFAGKETTLRLYQRVLVPNHTAGNAYWRHLRIQDALQAARN